MKNEEREEPGQDSRAMADTAGSLGMKAAQSKSRRLAGMSATLAGLVAVGSLLGGCGHSDTKPMDDEYAGTESSSAPSNGKDSGPEAGEGTPSASSRDGKQAAASDSGQYQDGAYALTGHYGKDGSDSIDVDLEVSGGKVQSVRVSGKSSSPVSRKHIGEFAKAVPGVVEGKPLKDLKVSKVAGASWTSDAFNKALDLARQEASVSQRQ
ncbi:FMN-binding protein [Bifidobacterium indicum]|nr:FMN-binding protein [uncultured Bifidobacterium sp.]